MTAASESLSPHQRLLLAAISRAPAEAIRAGSWLGSATWDDELARVTRENRLTSFVAELLADASAAPFLPAGIRERWREDRTAEIARVDKKLRQLRQIGALFAAADVRALVYKGPDFHERYYSPDRPRSFNDLDVILRRRDVEAAIGALTAAGYRLPPATPPLDYYLRFHLHAIYLHPEGGHPVEVHWALDSPYAQLPDPVPRLFEAAVPGDVLGPGLLRPSSVDALALMVLHLEKHLALCATLRRPEQRLRAVIDEGGLSWVLDVLRWLQRTDPCPDPTALSARLRQLSAERSLVIALRLACDVDASSLPPWANELAERLPRRTPLVARLLYPAAPGPVRSPLARFLQTTLPVVAFRPSRAIESLAPGLQIPGLEPRRPTAPIRAAVRRIGLGLRNLAALTAWWLRARVLGGGPAGGREDPQLP